MNIKQKGIIQYPDERLRVKCKRIKTINNTIKKQVNSLLAALKSIDSPWKLTNGVAANQIGLNTRIVILKRFGKQFITFINPEITYSSIPFISIEICASLLGIIRIKKRKLIIQVEYKDLNNDLHKTTLYGLAAFTMQQEIDHLNGKLIID